MGKVDRKSCGLCGLNISIPSKFLFVCVCGMAVHHGCLEPPMPQGTLLALIDAYNKGNHDQSFKAWRCKSCSAGQTKVIERFQAVKTIAQEVPCDTEDVTINSMAFTRSIQNSPERMPVAQKDGWREHSKTKRQLLQNRQTSSAWPPIRNKAKDQLPKDPASSQTVSGTKPKESTLSTQASVLVIPSINGKGKSKEVPSASEYSLNSNPKKKSSLLPLISTAPATQPPNISRMAGSKQIPSSRKPRVTASPSTGRNPPDVFMDEPDSHPIPSSSPPKSGVQPSIPRKDILISRNEPFVQPIAGPSKLSFSNGSLVSSNIDQNFAVNTDVHPSSGAINIKPGAVSLAIPVVDTIVRTRRQTKKKRALSSDDEESVKLLKAPKRDPEVTNDSNHPPIPQSVPGARIQIPPPETPPEPLPPLKPPSNPQTLPEPTPSSPAPFTTPAEPLINALSTENEQPLNAPPPEKLILPPMLDLRKALKRKRTMKNIQKPSTSTINRSESPTKRRKIEMDGLDEQGKENTPISVTKVAVVVPVERMVPVEEDRDKGLKVAERNGGIVQEVPDVRGTNGDIEMGRKEQQVENSKRSGTSSESLILGMSSAQLCEAFGVQDEVIAVDSVKDLTSVQDEDEDEKLITPFPEDMIPAMEDQTQRSAAPRLQSPTTKPNTLSQNTEMEAPAPTSLSDYLRFMKRAAEYSSDMMPPKLKHIYNSPDLDAAAFSALLEKRHHLPKVVGSGNVQRAGGDLIPLIPLLDNTDALGEGQDDTKGLSTVLEDSAMSGDAIDPQESPPVLPLNPVEDTNPSPSHGNQEQVESQDASSPVVVCVLEPQRGMKISEEVMAIIPPSIQLQENEPASPMAEPFSSTTDNLASQNSSEPDLPDMDMSASARAGTIEGTVELVVELVSTEEAPWQISLEDYTDDQPEDDVDSTSGTKALDTEMISTPSAPTPISSPKDHVPKPVQYQLVEEPSHEADLVATAPLDGIVEDNLQSIPPASSLSPVIQPLEERPQSLIEVAQDQQTFQLLRVSLPTSLQTPPTSPRPGGSSNAPKSMVVNPRTPAPEMAIPSIENAQSERSEHQASSQESELGYPMAMPSTKESSNTSSFSSPPDQQSKGLPSSANPSPKDPHSKPPDSYHRHAFADAPTSLPTPRSLSPHHSTRCHSRDESREQGQEVDPLENIVKRLDRRRKGKDKEVSRDGVMTEKQILPPLAIFFDLPNGRTVTSERHMSKKSRKTSVVEEKEKEGLGWTFVANTFSRGE